jgi:type II restriction/modification system DNA methylase subunit YeeA
MNKAKLKTYAPQARRDFIQAMTDRAAFYGLTAAKNEPMVERGDVAVIGGRSFPIAVARKRKALEGRINRHGFEQTMEAMAYTWFNRLVAIRYMELHGYLDHGYRVLSVATDKSQLTTDNEQLTTDNQQPTIDNEQLTPDIVRFAEHVDLPGLKRETVIDLKLAGNRESELYRLLLTAQCNALHTAMPFLFEKIDDETELLLPDNLLNSDSLIRKLVGEIEEEGWNEVEIIGWLYQFYISEKKDEVIGKVVASEDIPAATQLFTPNWIVKYLVQNTLGRQWMEHHPESPLKAKMEYYIEPAEQTEEVQEQLKEIVRQRAWRNRNLTTDCTDVTDLRNTDAAGLSATSVPSVVDLSLNPENLTLLDPACGSGHILVEAYDLFKAIYQERGYRARDIPALILQKNLFGMEIDDRAAQLAAFALMMKARADDRRIFDSEAKPNIVAFEDSKGMNANEIAYALNAPINKDDIPNEYLFEKIQEDRDGLFSKRALAEKGHVSQGDIASLLELFENAKTFGSLIPVTPKLAAKLPEIEKRLDDVLKFGDLTHASAHVLKPLLQQARLLARQYDAVVANPPYMGSSFFTDSLRAFVVGEFSIAKSDLYSCFMVRSLTFSKRDGCIGMITIPTWMFIASCEAIRKMLLTTICIEAFVHNGRGVWGSDFGSCSFVIRNTDLPGYKGVFKKLSEKLGSVASMPEMISRFFESLPFIVAREDFLAIPGCPIAFWASKTVRDLFLSAPAFENMAAPRQGMATTNNARFLRLWFEVNCNKIGFDASSEDEASQTGKKWFPFNKGGAFRKWYGNNEFVVNYENKGQTICDYIDNTPGARVGSNGRVINRRYYFKPGVTWTAISSGDFSVRYDPPGSVFSNAGMKVFAENNDESTLFAIAGFLNSKVTGELLSCLSETVNFDQGLIARLPFVEVVDAVAVVRELVELSREDWMMNETAWNFEKSQLITKDSVEPTVWHSFTRWEATSKIRLNRAIALEQQNNSLFIEAYGLGHQLATEVKDERITLRSADKQEDIKRLISYAIGCIMGRYSLDKLGLIYAHSGNDGFDASQYKTFRADDDGIIPLLESDWGIRDDATNRFVEFIDVCWPGESTTDDMEGTTAQTATASVPSVKSVVKTSPHLEENLKFVADSLGPTGSEQPRDTIRRYLSTGFYKHHLSMYKKRPIYWLFSSGKQRAFQCLVYLHRYHEGTLARMRTEYVIPLQGQIAARIEQLEGDKAKATSTSHRKKLQKEQDDLKKQQTELLTFEEKLKHAADQKISLDLDDGVKVNYAKFGDLLAEVKAVCGTKDDD